LGFIANLSFNHIKRQIAKAGLKEKLIEADGFKFHFYDSQNEKPVLILLNGFGISTEFQWYPVLLKLSKHFRLIMVNLVCFGESRTKAPIASIQIQVEFLERLITHLKIENFKLAGISYGGLVATEFTQKNEGQVEELFLIDSPVKYLNLDHIQKLCDSYGVNEIHEFFAPSTVDGLKKQFDAAYFKRQRIPMFILKEFHKAFCEPYLTGWKAIIKDLLDNYDFFRNRNYTFNSQTKLIWGQHDKVIPVSVGEKLKGYLPNAELFIVQNAGHLPTIEQPKELAELFN
jgi:pimeloyl-ACP methyl ester carboxylesterase